MDIFRLRSWTHYEPRDGRRPGVTALGFKAPAKSHTVMFLVTDIPETEPLTEEKILAALAEAGFVRVGTERQEVRRELLEAGWEESDGGFFGVTWDDLNRICPEPTPSEKGG